MRWQKQLRIGLAVLMAALAIGIGWYAARERAGGAQAAPTNRTDPEAVTEIWNDEFSRTENGVVVFRIKYEHALIYQDGRVRLEKMTGQFARSIAMLEHSSPEVAEQAFAAGLLHDIGKLLFAANLPGPFSEAMALSRNETKRCPRPKWK